MKMYHLKIKPVSSAEYLMYLVSKVFTKYHWCHQTSLQSLWSLLLSSGSDHCDWCQRVSSSAPQCVHCTLLYTSVYTPSQTGPGAVCSPTILHTTPPRVRPLSVCTSDHSLQVYYRSTIKKYYKCINLRCTKWIKFNAKEKRRIYIRFIRPMHMLYCPHL